MSLMLDDDELPPYAHTGGKCKCCGRTVEPTHDSVDCAFGLAMERDQLRELVHDLVRWGAVDGLTTSTTSSGAAWFIRLRAMAVKLGAVKRGRS